jgi:hypothetical protein
MRALLALALLALCSCAQTTFIVPVSDVLDKWEITSCETADMNYNLCYMSNKGCVCETKRKRH